MWNVADRPLRLLVRILAFFSIFLLLAVLFSFTSEDDTGDIYIALSCSFVFYSLSFYLMAHWQEPAGEREQKKKYERSVLDAALTQDIRQKLENCMHKEKPYLNSELTLPQLADQLKVSVHHLSQVINEQCGMNFSDFINQHRIEEMKIRLTDARYQHFKIEQLAFDTGFNSKSTFQAAFKKFTGLTPSEYRKQYNVPGVKSKINPSTPGRRTSQSANVSFTGRPGLEGPDWKARNGKPRLEGPDQEARAPTAL